ncbi:MAG: glutamate 5-kinase [Pseudohongiellaceae bacterium]
MRTKLASASYWVVKIGSSLLTNNGLGLDKDAIELWAEQLVTLQKQGKKIVLVSSGAVAEGVSRLGLKTRPRAVHLQQAAAAVGQMGLVQTYESSFMKQGVHAAQILLTHEDLANRTRYLNARTTLMTLLDMAVVPVVNENDTVATAELCFGDNDTLAALVANLINADVMVILTDQQGLLSADPRLDSQAPLVTQASATDPDLMRMAGGSGTLGRGGMQTKLAAASRAARSGTYTVIASGKEPNVLLRLARGEETGTLLTPDCEPVTARKRWLAGQLQVKGTLTLDAGAVAVLSQKGRSLLAVGVQEVKGAFSRGEMVACADRQGREIARGLTNYSSDEVALLRGQASSRIEELLGYAAEEEIIHRDNMVLT